MSVDVSMRVVGSCLVVVAYFVLTHVNLYAGVMTHLVGDLVSLPYFVRTKSWDVVLMLSFLLMISLSKLG